MQFALESKIKDKGKVEEILGVRQGQNRQKSDTRIRFGANGQRKKIEHSTKVETIEEYLFTRRDIAEH